jgi:hypothetical protein
MVSHMSRSNRMPNCPAVAIETGSEDSLATAIACKEAFLASQPKLAHSPKLLQ